MAGNWHQCKNILIPIYLHKCKHFIVYSTWYLCPHWTVVPLFVSGKEWTLMQVEVCCSVISNRIHLLFGSPDHIEMLFYFTSKPYRQDWFYDRWSQSIFCHPSIQSHIRDYIRFPSVFFFFLLTCQSKGDPEVILYQLGGAAFPACPVFTHGGPPSLLCLGHPKKWSIWGNSWTLIKVIHVSCMVMSAIMLTHIIYNPQLYFYKIKID